MTMNSKKIKNKKNNDFKSDSHQINNNNYNDNRFGLSVLNDSVQNNKSTPIAIPILSKLNLEELADLADIDEIEDQLDTDEEDDLFSTNYELSPENLSIDSFLKNPLQTANLNNNNNNNEFDLSVNDYDFDSSRNAEMLKNLSKLVELRSIYHVNNKNRDLFNHEEINVKNKQLTNTFSNNNNNNNNNNTNDKKSVNSLKSKKKDDKIWTPISQYNNSNKTTNTSKVNLFQIMPNQCYIDFSDVNNLKTLTENINKKSSLSISTSSSSLEGVLLNDSVPKLVTKQKNTNLTKKVSTKQQRQHNQNQKMHYHHHHHHQNHNNSNIHRPLNLDKKKLNDKSLFESSATNANNLLSDDKVLVNPNLFFNKIYTLIDSFNKLNYLNNNQFENGEQFESVSKNLLEWLIQNNYNKPIPINNDYKKSQKDELQSFITNSEETKDLLSEANTSIVTSLSTNNSTSKSISKSSSWPPSYKLNHDLKQNIKSLNNQKTNEFNDKVIDEINNQGSLLSKAEKFDLLRNKYIESKRRNKMLLNKIKKFKKSLNRDFKVIPRNDYKALIIQLKRYQEDFTLESKEKCHLRLFYEEKIQLLESMLNEQNKTNKEILPTSSSSSSTSSVECSKSKIQNSSNLIDQILIDSQKIE